MIIILCAIIAFVSYRIWNQRRPTAETGRLLRAAALLGATGCITMPSLWWSGLPEAALAAGVAFAVLGWHRARSSSPVT